MTARNVTTANGSGLDGREIEPAEPVWIRQDVHLNDLAVRNREADHGQHAPDRKARHDANVAIHENHLIGQLELRERRGLCDDRLSPTHEARHALRRSAISPQHDLWIQNGDQCFEVAVPDGREKRVDDAALLPQVRV
jgi:hypothetical protein